MDESEKDGPDAWAMAEQIESDPRLEEAVRMLAGVDWDEAERRICRENLRCLLFRHLLGKDVEKKAPRAGAVLKDLKEMVRAADDLSERLERLYRDGTMNLLLAINAEYRFFARKRAESVGLEPWEPGDAGAWVTTQVKLAEPYYHKEEREVWQSQEEPLPAVIGQLADLEQFFIGLMVKVGPETRGAGTTAHRLETADESLCIDAVEFFHEYRPTAPCTAAGLLKEFVDKIFGLAAGDSDARDIDELLKWAAPIVRGLEDDESAGHNEAAESRRRDGPRGRRNKYRTRRRFNPKDFV